MQRHALCLHEITLAGHTAAAPQSSVYNTSIDDDAYTRCLHVLLRHDMYDGADLH